jgi:hypothetical protein
MQRATIGDHAGVAGHEHEHLGRVAEAVIAQGQPVQNVVGDVIEKDEAQRQPAAGVEPEVAAMGECGR